MESGAFDVTVTIDSNEWGDDVTVTRHNAVVFVLFVVVRRQYFSNARAVLLNAQVDEERVMAKR